MVPPPERNGPLAQRRVFLGAFALFAGTIVFSLAGAALLNYGPALAAPALAWIAATTGLALDRLIMWPTWLNMAMLPVLAFTLFFRELGTSPDGHYSAGRAWRRSAAFLIAGSAIGAASELVGTQTGFPFGPYSYGEFLGPKIAGHVPWLIPPSWYALSLVSYDLARRLGAGRAGRILGTALFMVLWDVALDPAMNHAFPFWKYAAGGAYFGMPLVNWFGWALTSSLIALAYEFALGGLRAAPDAFVGRWSPALYATNSMLSIGVCLAYRAPLAALAGAAGLVLALGLVWMRRTHAPAPPAGALASA